MTQINKDYDWPFLVEPTKLKRLVDRIHERQLELPSITTVSDQFTVFMSGNRHDEIGTLDRVLALENSSKHKIQRLVIESSATTAGFVRPDHTVQVDFGNEIPTTSSNSTRKVISVKIRSDNTAWADRTLSEVEEQVERTRVSYAQRMAAVLFAIAITIILILTSPMNLESTTELVRPMWLRGPDLDRIQEILKQRRPITEAEAKEVLTAQLRNVLEDQRPRPRPPQPTSNLLVTIPLGIVILVTLILVVFYFPKAVFLWGDEGPRDVSRQRIRFWLWTIIVGVAVIGVLGSLLATGIAARVLPR